MLIYTSILCLFLFCLIVTCTREGEIDYDPTGRQCRCINGTLINCCRYRQDWLNLSNEQRILYLQTVNKASSDPLYRPLYRTLIQQYYNSSQTLAQSLDPSNTQFLPWHRYYLQAYEDMLRIINPKVYIPYWDWTLLPRTPYKNPIFSPTNGFGNYSNSTTKCVSNGPFAKGHFLLTSISGRGCLRRHYSKTTPFLSRMQLNDVVLRQTSFIDFFGYLTLPYLTVRCSIGGTICDINTSSPIEDPIHVLILSFIDSIWYRWQSMATSNREYYSNDNSPLVVTREEEGLVTVSHYSDASMLPYNTAICYGPPVDSISTNNGGGYRERRGSVGCPLDEWMDKLGLNQREKGTVRALCRIIYSRQNN